MHTKQKDQLAKLLRSIDKNHTSTINAKLFNSLLKLHKVNLTTEQFDNIVKETGVGNDKLRYKQALHLAMSDVPHSVVSSYYGDCESTYSEKPAKLVK
jgi:Ca2+-binding EF-hand superfamily protein